MPNPPQPPSPWSLQQLQQQYYGQQYPVGFPSTHHLHASYPPNVALYPNSLPAYPYQGNSQLAIPAYPTWNQANYPVAPYPGIHPTASQQVGSPSKRPKLEFRCDICDLTLDSETAHTAHAQTHIACQLCNYVASPKLVKAHYQSVHGKFSGTGFKSVTIAIPGCPVQRFKICVGDHPEDIAKWIAERKKRFPRKEPPKEIKPKEQKLLGNMLDGYGSSSSDEERETKEKQSEANNIGEAKASDNTSSNIKIRACRYFQRNGTCRNGDNCNFSHDVTQRQSTSQKSKLDPDNRRQQTKTKTSSTLLRKLLKTDEDRENALTLQLFRYIMDCNYLQEQREPK